METVTTVKDSILAIVGIIGGWLASLMGGFDLNLSVLLSLMAVDIATGLLAAIMNKSIKTEGGGLSSGTTFKGICKKFLMLILVYTGFRIDALLGTNGMIREGAIIAFSLNELISIAENAGLCGIPIPTIITNSIEVLKKKGESKVT